MAIVAVRHTTVDVPAGICYGQSDVALSSSFVFEKEQVIRELSTEDFQAVYSSPLTRCRMLAEYVSKGIPVICDSRLMELNFGIWEGLKWNEINKSDEAKLWFNDWLNIPCPKGESYKQLITRVADFFKQIVKIHSCENVLIVSHGGVIRALSSLVNKTEPKDAFNISIEYGSITKLKINE